MHPDVVDGREVGTVQEADGFRLWKRQSISLFAVIFGFLSIACFPSQPVSVDGEKGGAAEKQGLGSLRLSPAAFGQLILTPTSCAAGERQLFLGADFADEAAGVVVRLVVDPLDGPAVRVFAIAKPFDNSVVWRRTDCRIFHFSLESTGLRINRIEDYRIILDLDCSSQNGGSIEGHVSANHCH